MDWTTFDRKIRLKASEKDIYEAWMNIEILTKWFLRKITPLEVDSYPKLKEGDKVIWDWHNCDFPQEVEILKSIEYTSANFTFGHGMEVHIDISRQDEFNVLHLKQVNIPTDEEGKFNYYAGCKTGWTFWLVNLRAFLDHGILLHDTTLGPREDLFDFSNT